MQPDHAMQDSTAARATLSTPASRYSGTHGPGAIATAEAACVDLRSATLDAHAVARARRIVALRTRRTGPAAHSRTVAHSVERFLMHAARASPFPCSVGTLRARLGICACPRPCICMPCVQHSAHCVRLRVLRCWLNGKAHPADAARITHDVPSAFALRRRRGQAARERRGCSDARQSRRFRRRRLRRHRRRRRRLPLRRCGGHVGSGSARRR
jgi:hypothetical protein